VAQQAGQGNPALPAAQAVDGVDKLAVRADTGIA
jgi:hypothetical protein